MEKKVKKIIKKDTNILVYSLQKGKEYIKSLENIFLKLVKNV
jgi:hypothetical protein